MDECDTLVWLEGNWSLNSAVFNSPSALAWDSFQDHFTNKMKATCLEMKKKNGFKRVDIYAPTSDVYLIKLFKDRNRFKWIEWLWEKPKP
ncbi:hypothetical protein CEXT_359041 [Caerostris extrusa]|uniref:Uncharacterized protein n=1 Tax=Caerostris extrusa TaxID=172846 RepID=A0AAV4W4R6_CAEEX|nr:hypothetical protein CEXT_359041 [Caerostris extrusa]